MKVLSEPSVSATLSRAQAYAEKEEPGCLQYRISVDPHNKRKVCVFEVFVSLPPFDACFLLKLRSKENEAALAIHIESEVSKANVAFYECEFSTLCLSLFAEQSLFLAGGLSKPLDQQDIRIYTEYRA